MPRRIRKSEARSEVEFLRLRSEEVRTPGTLAMLFKAKSRIDWDTPLYS